MTAQSENTLTDAGNLGAIVATLASMASFTLNDTFVKLASAHLPLGEIIVIRNAFATVYILAFAWLVDGFDMPERPPWPVLSWRMAGEILATFSFLGALFAMPLADAVAIAQITPLVITAMGAILFKEHVGWRRWLAALAGLAGVLLIIRPGTSAFTPAALLALGSVVFVVMRDLATRRIAESVPILALAAMSCVSVFASGFLLLPFETWVWPQLSSVIGLAAGGLFLLGGHAFIISAMRSGEIAVVAPFRYSVIVWSLLSGYLVWGQLPDAVSGLGIVIVVAAGLYTFHRRALQR